jgi:hypothetical protein
MRLRVAALLAILHDDDIVDENFWGLAEQVVALSDRTRAAMLRSVARTIERGARSKGRLAALTESSQAEVVEEAVERVTVRIGKHVHAVGDRGISRAEQRRRLPSRDRGYFDAALKHAVDLGWIVEEAAENGQGAVLKPGVGQPA